jgi:hypothetical protein
MHRARPKIAMGQAGQKKAMQSNIDSSMSQLSDKVTPSSGAAKLNIMDFLDSVVVLPPTPTAIKPLYPSQMFMQKDEQEKYLLSLLTFGLDRCVVFSCN